MTGRQRPLAQSPPAPDFQWWPTIIFWVAMHLLLGLWIFGRAERPVWSSMFGGLFFLLAATLIFFISWVLGAFRLPRQILVPVIVLTVGVVLSSVQQGLFPVSAASNPVWSSVLQLLIIAGFVWLIGANIRMVVQRFQLQQRLANHDTLTGLLNRTGLQRILHHFTPEQSAVLLMMDLNDLKSINDLSGHDAGDQHIQAVAQAIQDALPRNAVASRWGGDEFLVVLPHATVEQGDIFAQTVMAQVPNVRLNLPALAFGAALLESPEDLQRAVAIADQRMYENKELVKSKESGTQTRSVPSAEEFMRLIEGLNSTHEVLQRGLDNLRLILGFDSNSYYEVRGASLQATYVSSPPEQREAPLHSLERDLTGGLLGQVLRTNSTVGTADYPSEAGAMAEWTVAGLRSLLATPVRDAGAIVGVLALTSYRNWRPITPHARRLLEAVALRLGYILERERVIREVERTVEGGLMTLGIALEARDVESFGHTQRVVSYAEQLGRALGLSPQLLTELRQGAYLHDIGKLMVPDALLRKPGRLTPEELATMQQHAQQGFVLASRIPNLSQGALDVILYHHENWGGGGYPCGRSGAQIPLLARVFTVCDVYEALLSVRPYKPAWSMAAALSEIEAQSGKKFDPEIVAAFLKLMRSQTVTGSEQRVRA